MLKNNRCISQHTQPIVNNQQLNYTESPNDLLYQPIPAIAQLVSHQRQQRISSVHRYPNNQTQFTPQQTLQFVNSSSSRNVQSISPSQKCNTSYEIHQNYIPLQSNINNRPSTNLIINMPQSLQQLQLQQPQQQCQLQKVQIQQSQQQQQIQQHINYAQLQSQHPIQPYSIQRKAQQCSTGFKPSNMMTQLVGSNSRGALSQTFTQNIPNNGTDIVIGQILQNNNNVTQILTPQIAQIRQRIIQFSPPRNTSNQANASIQSIIQMNPKQEQLKDKLDENKSSHQSTIYQLNLPLNMNGDVRGQTTCNKETTNTLSEIDQNIRACSPKQMIEDKQRNDSLLKINNNLSIFNQIQHNMQQGKNIQIQDANVISKMNNKNYQKCLLSQQIQPSFQIDNQKVIIRQSNQNIIQKVVMPSKLENSLKETAKMDRLENDKQWNSTENNISLQSKNNLIFYFNHLINNISEKLNYFLHKCVKLLNQKRIYLLIYFLDYNIIEQVY